MANRSFLSLANVQKLQLLLLMLSTAGVLCWITYYGIRGFDFTDEGFYLQWMAHPFDYTGSSSQFGFVYHPLYKFLNGNIEHLRIANIGITYGLAFWLTSLSFISFSRQRGELNGSIYIVSAAFASLSLIIFSNWLFTPNYNSLNFQGLLITIIGLIILNQNAANKLILGASFVALGGVLVFLAKATSALALAILVCVYIFLAVRKPVRSLLMSGALALVFLILAACLIDGSPMAFTERLGLGYRLVQDLSGGHSTSSMLRIDSLSFRKHELILFFITICTGIFLAKTSSSETRIQSVAIAILSILIVLLIYWTLITKPISFGFREIALRMPTVGIQIGAVIAVALAFSWAELKSMARQNFATVLLFLLLPLAFAFGSNQNYWQLSTQVSFFWLLSAVPFLTRLGDQINLRAVPSIFAFLTLMIVAGAFSVSGNYPYRQPIAVWAQETRLSLDQNAIGPKVGKEFAQYITTANSAAQQGGFVTGGGIIDLSGQSPGLLYALDAKSVGQAWIIGAYSGSDKFAKSALSDVTCAELSTAWVLTEPDGPRKIDTTVLNALGLNFPTAFKEVASWHTAEGAGGYAEARVQNLYRPIDPESLANTCSLTREENSDG